MYQYISEEVAVNRMKLGFDSGGDLDGAGRGRGSGIILLGNLIHCSWLVEYLRERLLLDC